MDYTLAKFSTIQVQNVDLYNASKIISLSGQTHMIQAEKTLVQSENANRTVCKDAVSSPCVTVARDRNPNSKWLKHRRNLLASGTAGFRAQMVPLVSIFFLFWVLSPTRSTSILDSTWWKEGFLPSRILSSASGLAGKSERFSSGSPRRHFIASFGF